MRPRSAYSATAGYAAGTLALVCFVALLSGCGQNMSQSGITTSSLPPEPRQRTYPPRPQQPPRYAWNGTSERLGYGARPYAQQPVTWQASPRGAPRYYAPPNALGYTSTVEVQAGETLYGIARRHGVSVASLVDANRLNGVSIYPGQRLTLPAGAR
jgi:hypothetical protein